MDVDAAIESVTKAFSNDPIICSSLATLIQVETTEQDDDEKERENSCTTLWCVVSSTLHNIHRATLQQRDILNRICGT